MSFPVLITQEGLNRAGNDVGIQLEIAAIGISDKGVIPTRTMTSVPDERLRVAITGGVNRGDGHWQLTAVISENATYPVHTVAFYLSDGTLFALWSHPTNVWFHQTPMNTPVQMFDLLLRDVPPDSINVNVTGSLQLFYEQEFFHAAIASVRQASTQIRLSNQQVMLNRKLNQLQRSLT